VAEWSPKHQAQVHEEPGVNCDGRSAQDKSGHNRPARTLAGVDGQLLPPERLKRKNLVRFEPRNPAYRAIKT